MGPTARYISLFLAVSLVLVMGLTTGCGLIQISNDSAQPAPTQAPQRTPLSAAGADSAQPVHTSQQAPSGGALNPASASNVIPPLPKVSGDAVALSVLITPLDAGFVEIAGERTLSSGQATEVNRNDQINLIARPSNPETWKFSRWGGDIQGPHASESLLMDSSKKIRAVFVKIDAPTVEMVNYYSFTVNGQPVRNVSIGLENGSVAVSPPPGPGDAPYQQGASVSLTASPNDGYQFEGWTGDCGGQGTCEVIMNSDINVTAAFSPLELELTTLSEPAEGGSVSPAGTSSFAHKAVVTVVAEAAEGYQFQGWSGGCSGSEGCTVLMVENRSVTALFAAAEWSITSNVTPPEGGTVSLDESASYAHGAIVQVTATPAQGFQFSEWTGDCQGGGECELTMDSDKTLTAVFVPVASPTDTQ